MPVISFSSETFKTAKWLILNSVSSKSINMLFHCILYCSFQKIKNHIHHENFSSLNNEMTAYLDHILISSNTRWLAMCIVSGVISHGAKLPRLVTRSQHLYLYTGLHLYKLEICSKYGSSVGLSTVSMATLSVFPHMWS